MSQTPRKTARRQRQDPTKQEEMKIAKLPSFIAKNPKQKKLYNYAAALESGNDSYPLILTYGPAGVGKSYVLAYAAVKLLVEGKIDQIILTRNPIPTGSSLGFFAGSESEKLAIWLGPILGTIKKILRTKTAIGTVSDSLFEYFIAQKKIIGLPMEVIKGYDFEKAFVIVEESQECSDEQLKNLITRVGQGSVIALDGDIKQSNSKLNGGYKRLIDAITKENEYTKSLNSDNPDYSWDGIHIPLVEFDKSEIVRSPIVKKIVYMFERQSL